MTTRNTNSKNDEPENDAEAKAKTQQELQAKTDASAKSKTGNKIFVAKWIVDHDNKRYQAGDKLSLTDEHAQPLLASGAIVLDGVRVDDNIVVTNA